MIKQKVHLWKSVFRAKGFSSSASRSFIKKGQMSFGLVPNQNLHFIFKNPLPSAITGFLLQKHQIYSLRALRP